jgi:hypothetical protein
MESPEEITPEWFLAQFQQLTDVEKREVLANKEVS